MTTQQKPRLSFWQIFNMSFGFLGIQFGFALQNSNVAEFFKRLVLIKMIFRFYG